MLNSDGREWRFRDAAPDGDEFTEVFRFSGFHERPVQVENMPR